MRRFLVLSVIYIISVSSVSAQDTILVEDFRYPKFRVGFSPSAMLHFLPAMQMSGDYGFRDGRMNLGLELGYIYKGGELTFFSGGRALNNSKGLASRLTLDFALMRGDLGALYMGLGYTYKRYAQNSRQWQDNFQDRFSRFRKTRDERRYNAIVFQCGFVAHLGDGFYIDVNGGLGSGTLKSRRYIEGEEVTNRRGPVDLANLYYNINFSYDLSKLNLSTKKERKKRRRKR